jgi:hypothetical protein
MHRLLELSLRVRHREHLRQDITAEVGWLRHQHGAGALEAARAKLDRKDLTSWGRLVMQGAIVELARVRRAQAERFGYWTPPWEEPPKPSAKRERPSAGDNEGFGASGEM